MNNKQLVLVSLLASFFPLFSETSEAVRRQDHKRPFEYLAGVYPNQDGEINTQLSLTVNYTDELSSAIGYYNKSYVRLDEKKADGDDVDEINDLRKIDISLNLLEYTKTISDKPLKIQLAPGMTFDFNYTKQNYELNSNWHDDNSGMIVIYLEKTERENYSFMPGMKFDILCGFFDRFTLLTGGAFIYSYDINKFEELSTTSDPDPLEQARAYYTGKYSVKYSSLGYKINIGIETEKSKFGSINLLGSYMNKSGESENSTKDWNGTENVFEKYTSKEIRHNISLDLYYHMNFITQGKLVPILKIGFENQIVSIDDYIDNDYGYQKFDFGLAFKF